MTIAKHLGANNLTSRTYDLNSLVCQIQLRHLWLLHWSWRMDVSLWIICNPQIQKAISMICIQLNLQLIEAASILSHLLSCYLRMGVLLQNTTSLGQQLAPLRTVLTKEGALNLSNKHNSEAKEVGHRESQRSQNMLCPCFKRWPQEGAVLDGKP